MGTMERSEAAQLKVDSILAGDGLDPSGRLGGIEDVSRGGKIHEMEIPSRVRAISHRCV